MVGFIFLKIFFYRGKTNTGFYNSVEITGAFLRYTSVLKPL